MLHNDDTSVRILELMGKRRAELVAQGELPDPDRTGLLGADYEIDQGRYRFKRVYRSTPYSSPSGFAPAPLDLPGARVKDGEYLIAVEDQNVDASQSITIVRHSAGQVG